jgi:hypothetical protein
MNPQPAPHIGPIFAILFIGVVAYHAFKNYVGGKTITLSDSFNLGYIESAPPSVIMREAPAVDNFESQQVYSDCLEALVSLGFKRKDATKKTKMIFKTYKPAPRTVQEFLEIILKAP